MDQRRLPRAACLPVVILGKKADLEVFRPEIPEGALVEKVKDGKIIDTYRQGANK